MQSERLYQALKGHGGTCRLVILPHESHGYRARENVLHCLYEQVRTWGMLGDSGGACFGYGYVHSSEVVRVDPCRTNGSRSMLDLGGSTQIIFRMMLASREVQLGPRMSLSHSVSFERLGYIRILSKLNLVISLCGECK